MQFSLAPAGGCTCAWRGRLASIDGQMEGKPLPVRPARVWQRLSCSWRPAPSPKPIIHAVPWQATARPGRCPVMRDGPNTPRPHWIHGWPLRSVSRRGHLLSAFVCDRYHVRAKGSHAPPPPPPPPWRAVVEPRHARPRRNPWRRSIKSRCLCLRHRRRDRGSEGLMRPAASVLIMDAPLRPQALH